MDSRTHLNWRKHDFADMILANKPEDASHLIQSDALGDADHIPVKFSPDVIKVGENECPTDVEPTRYDILGILTRKAPRLVQLQILPQKLLIVRELNHQRYLERILQIPEPDGTSHLNLNRMYRHVFYSVGYKTL